MSKYLFIIESPGKQKKIQSFLGKEYSVIPTYGHIMDLPPKKISVNIKKDFEPTYEVNFDKKEVVKKQIKRDIESDYRTFYLSVLDKNKAFFNPGSNSFHEIFTILGKMKENNFIDSKTSFDLRWILSIHDRFSQIQKSQINFS